MGKVVYSKFSNDRADRYKIRTDIELNNGIFEVYKRAVSKAAKTHIMYIYEVFRKLETCFEEVGIKLNKAAMVGDSVKLEYLDGKTLEQILDEHLKNDDSQYVRDVLKDFSDKLRHLAKLDFKVSQGFTDVFGIEFGDPRINKVFDDAKCISVSDIDLIPANIIVDGDEWIILDYEWTFDFAIPVDFIIFRMLNYYIESGRKAIVGNDIYELCGIKEAAIPVFLSMEESFQKYILGENIPLWKMYESFGKKYVMRDLEIYDSYETVSREWKNTIEAHDRVVNEWTETANALKALSEQHDMLCKEYNELQAKYNKTISAKVQRFVSKKS